MVSFIATLANSIYFEGISIEEQRKLRNEASFRLFHHHSQQSLNAW